MQSLRDDMFKRMNTSIDDIFHLMEYDEQIKITMLSLSGFRDLNRGIVYMGSEAMQRYNSFENAMLDKYYNKK